MKKTTLNEIRNSKQYAISNRYANVFELKDGTRVILTGTVIASAYSKEEENISIDLDKIEKVEVSFQDYKDEFKNDPRIKYRDNSVEDLTTYVGLLQTEDILTDLINDKLPMITSYHLDEIFVKKQLPLKIAMIIEKDLKKEIIKWSGDKAADWEQDRYKNKDIKERSQMNRKIKGQK